MGLDALNSKDDFVDVNDFVEHNFPPQRSVVNVKLYESIKINHWGVRTCCYLFVG